MSRAATTSDPFNAIAEGRRRDILTYLAAEERAVIAANLLESLRHDTDVRDGAALRDFDVRPRGLRQAVAEALAAS